MPQHGVVHLTPDSSFELMWALGGAGDGSSNWVPSTHMGHILMFLALVHGLPAFGTSVVSQEGVHSLCIRIRNQFKSWKINK